MRLRPGYTDPFLSPVSGILSSSYQLPEIPLDYTFLGNQDKRAELSPAIIDLRLDVIELRRLMPFDISTSSFLTQKNEKNLRNSQSLESLVDDGILKTVNHSLELAVANTDYLTPDLEQNKIWIGDENNKVSQKETIQVQNLPNLTYAKVWQGDTGNRPVEVSLDFAGPNLTYNYLWMGSSSNRFEERLTISVINLPNLTSGKVWQGDTGNRPVEVSLEIAPPDAKYIIQQPNAGLSNAQALSELIGTSPRMLKASLSGVIEVAVPDEDYATKATLERLRDEAQEAAEEASASAEEATAAAEEATGAAAEATGAAAEASASAAEASVSAIGAGVSAGAAAASATAAAGSADRAGEHADDAADSATSAQNSANSAQSSATSAASSLATLLSTGLNALPNHGDVNFQGYKGINAGTPTLPSDLTTKSYVDSVVSGIGTLTQYAVLVGGASNTINSLPRGTLGQILQSGGNAANPSYSAAIYPSTTTVNQLLYSSSANVISGLATANNRILATNGSGIPAFTSTLPFVVPVSTGGTGLSTTTINQILYSSDNNTISGLPTSNSGVLITSSLGVPSISSTLPSLVQSNITALGIIASGTWNGSLIGLNYGGTNANLTASNGGILYSTASALAVLAGTPIAGQILRSGVSSAPSWSIATYPSTTAINQLLYSSSANVISGLSTANNSILATNGSGAPAFTSTLPFTVPVSSGGTGLTSTTAYGVLCGGTVSGGNFQNAGAGLTGQVLTSNGASALPTWQNPTLGTVTSVGATTSSTGLSITGSPITSSGTLTFTLNAQLQGLAAMSTPGLVVQTVSGTYTARSIAVGSSNLTISNGSGSLSNPTIDLATSLTGIASLVAGNLLLVSNRINASNTNGNITLSPNGTGALQLSNGTNAIPLQFYNAAGTFYVALKAGSLSANTTWVLPTSDSSGFFKSDGAGNLSIASVAPTTSKYIIQTADASLPNAQVLGALSNGILKNTTTTGVLSIANAGFDYYSPGKPITISVGLFGGNLFMGNTAGNNTLVNSYNIGIGDNSLVSLTYGYSDVFIGPFSGRYITTGSYCCGIGDSSQGANISGSANVSMGTLSLGNVQTSSDNVGVGHTAGSTPINPTQCVFLGSYSDATINNIVNAIAIGYNAKVSSSNSMVLGNGVNVGIGTSSPLQKLHVSNSGTVRFFLENTLGGAGQEVSIDAMTYTQPAGNRPAARIRFLDTNYSNSIFLQTKTPGAASNTLETRLYVGYDGKVGVGTINPDQLFSVSTSSPSKITSGAWTAYSDGRIKKVLGNFDSGLKEIEQLQVRRFKFNKASEYKRDILEREFVGFIAQEVEDVIPECIVERQNKNNMEDVRVFDVTPVTYALVNAIKELSSRVKTLEKHTIH